MAPCGRHHDNTPGKALPTWGEQLWNGSFQEDGWYVLISFIEQEKVTPANPASQILGAFPKFCDWPKIPGCVVALALVWFYWFFLTSSWCVVDLLLISCWRCCWRCWWSHGVTFTFFPEAGVLPPGVHACWYADMSVILHSLGHPQVNDTQDVFNCGTSSCNRVSLRNGRRFNPTAHPVLFIVSPV